MPAPSPKGRLSRLWKNVRPYARVLFVLVAVGLIAWVLTDHSAELAGASAYLTHIKWEWLVVGILAELGSIVAYALVQQRLIEAGKVAAPIGWLTGVTLATGGRLAWGLTLCALAATIKLPAAAAILFIGVDQFRGRFLCRRLQQQRPVVSERGRIYLRLLEGRRPGT